MIQGGAVFLVMLALFVIGGVSRNVATWLAAGYMLIGLGLLCFLPGFIK